MRLDPALRKALDNVSIAVEDRPEDGSPEQFGVYEGIPRTVRDGYNFAVPDRIVIYRIPLETAFPDRAELEEQIRITVLHEIGHHFGMDEDRLDDIGFG